MPGTRSSARERARAAALGPERLLALHALLVAELPHLDRALVGYDAILAYLASLHIRRLNGRPLHRRMLQRWRLELGCPILPGGRLVDRAGKIVRTPALSTRYAVTAWILSRYRSGELFKVDNRPASARTGKRHQEKSSPCPRASSRAA